MIKFTYTKKNGEVSERVGLLVSSPNKAYGVLDISDLDTEQQAELDVAYKAYCAERDAILATLNTKYNISALPYKNFLPEGMSNIEVI